MVLIYYSRAIFRSILRTINVNFEFNVSQLTNNAESRTMTEFTFILLNIRFLDSGRQWFRTRKFLQETSHDAVITLFIVAHKGNGALNAIRPKELRYGNIRNLKNDLKVLGADKANEMDFLFALLLMGVNIQPFGQIDEFYFFLLKRKWIYFRCVLCVVFLWIEMNQEGNLKR